MWYLFPKTIHNPLLLAEIQLQTWSIQETKPGQEELAVHAGTPDQNGKDCDILGIAVPCHVLVILGIAVPRHVLVTSSYLVLPSFTQQTSPQLIPAKGQSRSPCPFHVVFLLTHPSLALPFINNSITYCWLMLICGPQCFSQLF